MDFENLEEFLAHMKTILPGDVVDDIQGQYDPNHKRHIYCDYTKWTWFGASPKPVRDTRIDTDDLTNLKILLGQFTGSKNSFDELIMHL